MRAHASAGTTLSNVRMDRGSAQSLLNVAAPKSAHSEPPTVNSQLIALFEDALMRCSQTTIPKPVEFEDTLVIDMRGGMFAAASISLDTDQRFKRTP